LEKTIATRHIVGRRIFGTTIRSTHTVRNTKGISTGTLAWTGWCFFRIITMTRSLTVPTFFRSGQGVSLCSIVAFLEGLIFRGGVRVTIMGMRGLVTDNTTSVHVSTGTVIRTEGIHTLTLASSCWCCFRISIGTITLTVTTLLHTSSTIDIIRGHPLSSVVVFGTRTTPTWALIITKSIHTLFLAIPCGCCIGISIGTRHLTVPTWLYRIIKGIPLSSMVIFRTTTISTGTGIPTVIIHTLTLTTFLFCFNEFGSFGRTRTLTGTTGVSIE